MALEMKKRDNLPEFIQMDSFDAIQILNEEFRNKLVYEMSYYDEKTKTKKTKHELTFIGIKQLILELAHRGEAMKIVTQKTERVHITDKPEEDTWQSEVILENTKTGQQSLGVSESQVCPLMNWPVLDPKTGKKIWNDTDKRYETVYERRYDPFGKTSAISKAIRNAEKQQLPEMAIQLFVESAMKSKDSVQSVHQLNQDGSQKIHCDCPLGVRDWDYENQICKQCVLPLPPDAKSSFPKGS